MKTETKKFEIIKDLSNEDYHNLPSFSSSQIKDAVEYNHPMAFFRAKHIDKALPRVESAAMGLGTAIHTAWMEPELFESEFITEPKIDKRTKQGKADYQIFLDEAANKNIISIDTERKVLNMKRALDYNFNAKSLLEHSIVESSVFWTDEETGLDLRVRPDIWREGLFIADLKSTKDASRAEFQKTIYKFGYHISAAMYLDGMRAIGQPMDDFIFICVESSAPYLTAIYTLSEDALDIGYREYREALKNIKKSVDSGIYKGHNRDKITEISLPSWVMAKEI